MERTFIKKTLIGSVFLLALFIFGWRCPFQQFTGLACPGCMMTTALYYLLQLDFQTAFYFNPAIYVLVIGGILALICRKNKQALHVIAGIVIVLWLGIYLYRMAVIYPNYPMHYVEDNTIHKIMMLFQNR